MTQFKDKMEERIKTELTLEGKSKYTIRSYCYYNNKFLEFSNKDPNGVVKDDLKLFLAHLLNKGCNPKTLALARSALRYFYDEILKKGMVDNEIKTPKFHKKLPDVPTKGEIKKLLAEPKSIKSQLFIELLYSAGLRVSECAALRWDNLNFEDKTGLIRSGKGNKDRFFILSDAVIADLRNYQTPDSQYIFPGKCDGHISTRTIQRQVNKAAKNAGITKHIYCHVLRHAFGTHLAESGTDIRMIQELMGHENIQTTQIYTTLSRNVLKSVKSPLDTI